MTECTCGMGDAFAQSDKFHVGGCSMKPHRDDQSIRQDDMPHIPRTCPNFDDCSCTDYCHPAFRLILRDVRAEGERAATERMRPIIVELVDAIAEDFGNPPWKEGEKLDRIDRAWAAAQSILQGEVSS